MMLRSQTAGEFARELGLPEGWSVCSMGIHPNRIHQALYHGPGYLKAPLRIRADTLEDLIEELQPYRQGKQTELFRAGILTKGESI